MNLHYSLRFQSKKGPCKLDSQLHGPQEMLMAMGRLLSGYEPYALSWGKLGQGFDNYSRGCLLLHCQH